MRQHLLKKLIAVVDDEPDIVELIALHLQKEGFEVLGFYNGGEFLSHLTEILPDLVVLDLLLPDIDGLEICQLLKRDEKTSCIPIIMLTAKGAETDKVVGLELGADDYIAKPFSPRELIARVKSVLRRTTPQEGRDTITKIGEIVIDPARFEVSVKGRLIDLTPTEFRILQILAQKRGKVFTRNQLLERLWGDEKVVMDRTIDVHIRRLREKLGKAGEMIRTIRGIGYKAEERSCDELD